MFLYIFFSTHYAGDADLDRKYALEEILELVANRTAQNSSALPRSCPALLSVLFENSHVNTVYLGTRVMFTT